MVLSGLNDLVVASRAHSCIPPPIAENLWTFLTYGNPIYRSLVSHLNEYERLKLAMSSPLIQQFMFSIGALSIEDGPVMDCKLFIRFLPGPKHGRSLLIHFKTEELVLPALFRLAVPTFPKMLKVITLSRLDVTLDGVCEFLITENSNVKHLIIRHTARNVNPGDRGLLASCVDVSSLEIHQGGIDREIAVRIGMLHLTEVLLIGVRICVTDVRFVVRELSRCYYLHTLIWKYYGTDFETNIDSYFAERVLAHCQHDFRRLRVLELTTFQLVPFPQLLKLPELRTLTLNLSIDVRRDGINLLYSYLRQVCLRNSRTAVHVEVYKIHRGEYTARRLAILRSFWEEAGVSFVQALPNVDFRLHF